MPSKKAGIADALVAAEILIQHPHVRGVSLFGSVARPDSVLGNDLDMIVVVDVMLATKFAELVQNAKKRTPRANDQELRSKAALAILEMLESNLPDVLWDPILVPQQCLLPAELEGLERALGLPDGYMLDAFASARLYQRASRSFPYRGDY